ncbi:MAG: hybrid sensor histidine kinase/response regulator [Pseudomonadales bacterium]|nr:hybrid sensor histidine kinase/response regulator [Pseudomonadales bacterium]
MVPATNNVQHAQIDYVFKQLTVTGLPHAAVVTLTAVMLLWDALPDWNIRSLSNMPDAALGIVVWFVLLQSGHVLRILLLDRLWKTNQGAADYRATKPLLILGMLGTGCVWSAVPGFFMEGISTETFIFASIVIAGMVAATLPALAAYLPAYLCFAFPLLIVLTYRYLSLDMAANGLLTLCYLVAVVVISGTINRLITQSITMDFKQRSLLEEVTLAKEHAEHANVAKSRFLAAASHDLRQPLQALGLILESLRLRSKNQPEFEALVKQGLSSHNALSELFNALLELSRLEANQLEVQRTSFELYEVLNSIVVEYQTVASEKDLQLLLRGEACIVDTDPVMLGRVMRNLLTNALKFTDHGSVTVCIEPFPKTVNVSVIDTGIGIPCVEHERVFDEYHQVSNQARRREEGIGLGLSVVKKICALLNHEIKLVSELGKGSVFTVSLPYGTRQISQASQPISDAIIAGLNVWVVDDEPAVLAAVGSLLQDWQCKVSSATSIPELLKLLNESEQPPDFIISDYRIGEQGSGIDAIEALRSRLGKKIPGFLMSGDTDPRIVEDIESRGYLVLQKPVKPARMKEVIELLLRPVSTR